MNTTKHNRQSPCLTCKRVSNPDKCENKLCQPWRRWFLTRWAEIHTYAHHEIVSRNLSKDPCDGCVCFGDACTVPCQTKRIWQEQNGGKIGELEE